MFVDRETQKILSVGRLKGQYEREYEGGRRNLRGWDFAKEVGGCWEVEEEKRMQGAVAGKYEGSAPPRVKDIHSLALIGSSTQEQGKPKFTLLDGLAFRSICFSET